MKSSERAQWRKVAALVVITALALAAAGCGGGRKGDDTRVEGVTLERPDASRGDAKAVSSNNAVTAADPTTTTAPAPPEAEQGLPLSDPEPTTTTEPPAPEPASIEVRFEPAEGDEVTATLEGTDRTLSLASGVALFDGLADGTYRVFVTIVHPPTASDGTGVGSQEIIRSVPIGLVAGDHAVVTCANDCVAVL